MNWLPSSEPKTILVVDDNTDLRQTLCEILRSEGYLVYQADNGKSAESCCDQYKINLLITDIFMPEQDGIETICRLQYKMPSLKIIAMSGEGPGAAETYLKAARNLGALQSLPKPFKAHELLDLITGMLTENLDRPSSAQGQQRRAAA